MMFIINNRSHKMAARLRSVVRRTERERARERERERETVAWRLGVNLISVSDWKNLNEESFN